MRVVIGVDPGLDGGLAAIPSEGDPMVIDTPVFTIKGPKKKQRHYAVAEIVQFLAAWKDKAAEVYVVIESVHSMPEQGVASSFNFGRGFGLLEGIVAGLGLPYELVSPQRWKKAMLPDVAGKDKDAFRLRAQQLFPNMVAYLSRKCDDGRAEALLMAEYARRAYPQPPKQEFRQEFALTQGAIDDDF